MESEFFDHCKLDRSLFVSMRARNTACLAFSVSSLEIGRSWCPKRVRDPKNVSRTQTNVHINDRCSTHCALKKDHRNDCVALRSPNCWLSYSIFSTFDVKTNYKSEYQVQDNKTMQTKKESQNQQGNWFVTSLENPYFCVGNSKLNLISH